MPDSAGNLTPTEITQGLQQFMGGPVGYSPMTTAAVNAFQQQSLPVIQQQFELMGMGRSPAMGQAVGSSLTQALVPFIQGDLNNRMQALQLGLGQQQVGQGAARTAADIANQSQQTQLQGLGLAGNLGLGMGQLYGQAGNAELERQKLALQAYGSAGQAQQGVTQSALDAQQQDFLRRQALAEQGSFGIFGGSVIPPTLSAGTKSVATPSGGK